MAITVANPFAIQMAMKHKDIKTTMIYVSLGKSHIREQVERLNKIQIPAMIYAQNELPRLTPQAYQFVEFAQKIR